MQKVMRETCSTFIVPNSGAGKYFVKAVTDFMSGCGCGRAILQSDGEMAIVAFRKQ